MQTLIVILIVAAALFWAVRHFQRLFSAKTENPCGCGCSGCNGTPGRDKGLDCPSQQTQEPLAQHSPDPTRENGSSNP
ncbi:MAG: FeoB-associated Cys-rich membrane protein, partial [Desulfobacterales bacterium]